MGLINVLSWQPAKNLKENRTALASTSDDTLSFMMLDL
jgi:hypothetical protein